MIEYHRYTLKGRRMAMEREGALLRIDGGYADCHPWPELGDLPLKEQLEKLSNNEITPLTKQSLYFAKIDKEAREQKRSLFENLTIPKSHELLFTISDPSKKNTLVKIKLGKDLPNEKEALKKLIEKWQCQVRLDFNERITRQEFELFLEEMKPYLAFFDCIEDPFPYDASSWKQIQDRYSISLASDILSERAIGALRSAKVLVLKPAIQSHIPFQNLDQKLIVTSYLDHPLGQLSAAWTAARLKTDTCGLCSHHVYQTNEFSEQFPQEEGVLTPPSGTGFGFDELLEKLSWKKL